MVKKGRKRITISWSWDEEENKQMNNSHTVVLDDTRNKSIVQQKVPWLIGLEWLNSDQMLVFAKLAVAAYNIFVRGGSFDGTLEWIGAPQRLPFEINIRFKLDCHKFFVKIISRINLLQFGIGLWVILMLDATDK